MSSRVTEEKCAGDERAPEKECATQESRTPEEKRAKILTLHVLSDSVGETADIVAHIIALQFPQFEPCYEFTTMIESASVLRDTVLPHKNDPYHIFVYTFTNRSLAEVMRDLVDEHGVNGVDVMGGAIELVSKLTGEDPTGAVGILHQVDNAYFQRIAAMEYAVNHDDGQQPETLPEADIVLIGVSRSSKTPLAMYLAHRGYKTANIPLTSGTNPPDELYHVDPRRIFGLMSNVETIVTMRRDRMRELGTYVPGYADPAKIDEEFADARELMRQLGCLVINTEGRAIESIAQEIITHLNPVR